MQEMKKIRSKTASGIVLKAIPGHFVTPNSHVNYYLDMTTLKSRLSEASAAARGLSSLIAMDTVVDTIVCVEGCEIIGAYLAEELTNAGIYSMNAHNTIYIVTPEPVSSGQFLFRENILPMIKGKNVLLLAASATTGQNILKAVEALKYYGAAISGVCAIFSAANKVMDIPVKSLFSVSDIPDYKSYIPEKCEMCIQKQPIDAFANSFGYSRIN